MRDMKFQWFQIVIILNAFDVFLPFDHADLIFFYDFLRFARIYKINDLFFSPLTIFFIPIAFVYRKGNLFETIFVQRELCVLFILRTLSPCPTQSLVVSEKKRKKKILHALFPHPYKYNTQTDPFPKNCYGRGLKKSENGVNERTNEWTSKNVSTFYYTSFSYNVHFYIVYLFFIASRLTSIKLQTHPHTHMNTKADIFASYPSYKNILCVCVCELA